MPLHATPPHIHTQRSAHQGPQAEREITSSQPTASSHRPFDRRQNGRDKDEDRSRETGGRREAEGVPRGVAIFGAAPTNDLWAWVLRNRAFLRKGQKQIHTLLCQTETDLQGMLPWKPALFPQLFGNPVFLFVRDGGVCFLEKTIGDLFLLLLHDSPVRLEHVTEVGVGIN